MNPEENLFMTAFAIGYFVTLFLLIAFWWQAAKMLGLFQIIAKSDGDIREDKLQILRDQLVKRARAIIWITLAGLVTFVAVGGVTILGSALVMPDKSKARFAEAFGGTFGLYVCFPVMLILVLGGCIAIAVTAWRQYRQVGLIIPKDFRNPNWRRFWPGKEVI